MSRLMAVIYDRIMRGTEQACLQQWRGELLGQCYGRVLEIGAGTGASLPLYPKGIEELLLCEPDDAMRRQLDRRLSSQDWDLQINLASFSGEQLVVEDGSVDCVVSSLVLCSVSHQPSALEELFRVLKPGGILLFVEHVAAPKASSRYRWQRRIEPFWKRMAGNCHLTRCTEQAIVDTGFVLDRVERESLRKAPPFVRPSIRGVARKPN
ncbi:methyltransferase domain-containing protein [Aestuariirhabdus sp. Z084]|uniref:class I SAM-dependent methyltransferase n=1 Tax=Aestuariirhabdus haliotis TaxID=2918751 RepID=UPI00201B4144|nr:class I SAM-dependent methyltransferase [Aestuariirhabdus haliotis]MCL6414916.1 methyltransferase domain-containing protein [Aestuariirhabdus haliotis]MCL6418848.1 methyltransferase domain-containing protein [Aestuariirhabdus haliotis]